MRWLLPTVLLVAACREPDPLDELFGMEDSVEFTAALYDHIAAKSERTGAEWVVYRVWTLESAVDNGGFKSYAYAPGGEESSRAAAAFDAIGAKRTAAIVRAAVPVIDAMVSKGMVHSNKAARHKSRLAQRISAMS